MDGLSCWVTLLEPWIIYMTLAVKQALSQWLSYRSLMAVNTDALLSLAIMAFLTKH
jgi:hypothetical protein